jgi:hypothetical protein
MARVVPSSNMATAMTTSWAIRAPVKARGPVLAGGEVVGEEAEELERVDGDVVAGDGVDVVGVVVVGVVVVSVVVVGPLDVGPVVEATGAELVDGDVAGGDVPGGDVVVRDVVGVAGGETAMIGGDVVDGEVPRFAGVKAPTRSPADADSVATLEPGAVAAARALSVIKPRSRSAARAT